MRTPQIGKGLRSSLVVISWWSNCLALDCLDKLLAFTTHRPIYVVQVGKSPEQKARFRARLPERVVELDYPENLPGEHSRVIYTVAFSLLAAQAGIWLVDHDVFFQAGLEDWLDAADDHLAQGEACLCLPRREPGNPANTNPLFWLSPRRWPAEIDCIDPIPFQMRDESRRPDLFRSQLSLVMPQKDTLMQAKEMLEPRGMVSFYPLNAGPGRAERVNSVTCPLESLPVHRHLGGLSLFASQVPADLYQQLDWFRCWVQETVSKFVQFYETCPSEWLDSEDPVLIQRLGEYREFVHV